MKSNIGLLAAYTISAELAYYTHGLSQMQGVVLQGVCMVDKSPPLEQRHQEDEQVESSEARQGLPPAKPSLLEPYKPLGLGSSPSVQPVGLTEHLTNITTSEVPLSTCK
jgi:hypothetical protein